MMSLPVGGKGEDKKPWLFEYLSVKRGRFAKTGTRKSTVGADGSWRPC